MKKKILFFILICFAVIAKPQDFNTSSPCQENAENNGVWATNRGDLIDATFKIAFFGPAAGDCSGTLVNRNIGAASLGYYCMLAKHCVDGVDFNTEHDLYFHYQSPDGNTSNTAFSNQGNGASQSTALTDNFYEYRHHTKLRLVADYTWGDFALCEILTPLPAHFNVYFAGWNSSMNYSEGIGIGSPPCGGPNPYVGLHHPEADIKKMSGTTQVAWLENQLATDCYTITTIIDVLFGWIWGNSVSTQSICNYVDNPWLVIPSWCHGGIQEGSSGSGLFNGNNKLIGVLSGDAFNCASFDLTTYGKFRNNYYNQTVKNTLNPSNDVWVDVAGLSGRRITCYQNLDVPGASGVSGQYFPANHYQSNNNIVIQAAGQITQTGFMHIISGANYEFKAPVITIDPNNFNNFSSDPGAEFSLVLESCTPTARVESETAMLHNQIIEQLSNIQIPKHKDFDVASIISSNNGEKVAYASNYAIMKVYPNPNDGIFTIEAITDNKEENYNIRIMDPLGRVVIEKIVTNNGLPMNKYIMNLQDFEDGIYFVMLSGNNFKLSQKITLKK